MHGNFAFIEHVTHNRRSTTEGEPMNDDRKTFQFTMYRKHPTSPFDRLPATVNREVEARTEDKARAGLVAAYGSQWDIGNAYEVEGRYYGALDCMD